MQAFFSPNKQMRISKIPPVQAESMTASDAINLKALVSESIEESPAKERSTVRRDFSQSPLRKFVVKRGASPPVRAKGKRSVFSKKTDIRGSASLSSIQPFKAGSNLSRILLDPRRVSPAPSDSSLGFTIRSGKDLKPLLTMSQIACCQAKFRLPLAVQKIVVQFCDIQLCIRIAYVSKALNKCQEVPRQMREIIMGSHIRSTAERRLYWAHKTYSREPSNFEALVLLTRLDPQTSSDIQKDLNRTFPQLQMFGARQVGAAKLSRLLHALAAHKELGYTQGMNFIGAIVLIQLFMNELAAFEFLRSLMF